MVAERIRESLEKTPLIYNGKEIKMTASFGVKEINVKEINEKEFINLPEIIKDVDKKLYEAKRSGRNKVVY